MRISVGQERPHRSDEEVLSNQRVHEQMCKSSEDFSWLPHL